MNKDINKAITTKPRQRSRLLKEATQIHRLAYKKSRNYCVSIMSENRKTIICPLNIKWIIDIKSSWRVVQPKFSKTVVTTNRVILRYGEEVMSGRLKVADTLNIFFVNAGNTLRIDRDKRFLLETNNIFDPVLMTLKKHSANPSVININKNKQRRVLFSKC